jgi:uncharacterized protein
MRMSTFLRHLALALLIALAWRHPAFCGEIHDAANNGDLQKVKALLRDNPELVSTYDSNGWTPLQLAAHNGHRDIAELLLANKADINAKVLRVSNESMRLYSRSDLTSKLKHVDWTPMHLAVAEGHKDVVELLLAKGADLNAKTNMGMTPLDLAVSNSREDLAELLHRRGGSAGAEGLYVVGKGVISPEALVRPLPPLTEKARVARIDGGIFLQAIVRKDGTVDSIKVLKGLGYGLDESAVNTVASKWRFKPGTLNGAPVDVIVDIYFGFHVD